VIPEPVDDAHETAAWDEIRHAAGLDFVRRFDEAE
jgi:hypothetical protein